MPIGDNSLQTFLREELGDSGRVDEWEQIRPGKAERGGTEGIFSPLNPKPLTSPIPSPLSPAPRSLLYFDGDGGYDGGEWGVRARQGGVSLAGSLRVVAGRREH